MHFPAAFWEQELTSTKLNEDRFMYKALEVLAEFILGRTGTPEAFNGHDKQTRGVSRPK